MNEERKYHGHVIAVNAEKLGDNLDADAAAGTSVLVVGDVADFDELGGSLLVDGVVLRYSTCDDDAGTVTLSNPLPADAELGDPIYVWDTQRLSVAMEYIAQVEIDADDEGDPIEAVIASHLVDDLPDGIRGLVGESVLMEEDDDEWRIIDVLGLDKSGTGTLFYDGPDDDGNDAITVTTPGDQTINLTHLPITHSEHLYWNGIYQPGTEWTRVGQVITVPDPGGVIAVGDELVVEYAYQGGTVVVDTSGDTDASAWEAVDIKIGSASFPMPDSVAAGDLLLLFAGRNITAGPAGWTEEAVVSYNVARNVALYSKVSDGTETSVSYTVASSNPGSILVVIRGWTDFEIIGSQSVSPAPASYTPPGGNLKFAALDGDAGFGQEIGSIDPEPLALHDCASWGMGAAEGEAVFNGIETGDDQVWYGITMTVS